VRDSSDGTIISADTAIVHTRIRTGVRRVRIDETNNRASYEPLREAASSF